MSVKQTTENGRHIPTASRILVVIDVKQDKKKIAHALKFCNILFANNETAVMNALPKVHAVIIDDDQPIPYRKRMLELCISHEIPFMLITSKFGITCPRIRRPLTKADLVRSVDRYLGIVPKGHVLLLNNHKEMVTSFTKFANLKGFVAHSTANIGTALKIIKHQHIVIAVVDHNLASRPGQNFLDFLKRNYPDLKILETDNSIVHKLPTKTWKEHVDEIYDNEKKVRILERQENFKKAMRRQQTTRVQEMLETARKKERNQRKNQRR